MTIVPKIEKTASPGKSKWAWITGSLAVIGCMVACSLPFLAAGGVLAGLGALAAGWWFAAVVALVGAGIALIVVRRRKAAAASAADSECGCGGNC
ncbi:hypothetical protein [Pseudarthrobacter siccitolerans]|nr:hypothetical protein [Pseudarthrobacter siccitolerans]